MKKKVLSGLFALALLVASSYGVNQSIESDVDLSDLALANVEALAEGESGSDLCKTYCTPASEWECKVYVNGILEATCSKHRKK